MKARAFDGSRPCARDVIVNFIRKPLLDGSDRKFEAGALVSVCKPRLRHLVSGMKSSHLTEDLKTL